MPTTLPVDEIRAWLRLTLEPGLGPAQARSLLVAVGLPQDVYNSSTAALAKYVPYELAAQLSRPASATIEQQIDAALNWLKEPNRAIVTLADPHYPKALLDIHDPPLLLYVNGNLSLLSRPTLSIVGARNATPGGIDNAKAFARHLASKGWCVASGLAAGIDTAAHEGALSASPKGGSTIAVMATGLDIVYPASNLGLAHRIAQEGLLISEAPLGTPSKSYLFPRRNRIVAGLAQGVLVVEATQKSGSLITARLATEMGREVFAIPGSIHSPQSRGCHALIRQGAKLVESGEDITDELRQLAGSSPKGPAARVARGARASVFHNAAPPDPDGSSCAAPIEHDAQERVSSLWPPGGPLPDSESRSTPDTKAKGTAVDDEQSTEGPIPIQTRLLNALGYDPVDIDTLHRRTGIDVARLNGALLELELSDRVVRLTDGRVQQLAP